MQRIILEDIRVRTFIGVSGKERAKKQHLSVSIEVEPAVKFEEIDDNIENTVNYSSIRKDVKELLKDPQYKLIETVAALLAHHVMDAYPVKSATVRVQKFPYRDTKSVSCSFTLDTKPREA
jgi:FolB domain-containing protein